jgi:hypothetical protein
VIAPFASNLGFHAGQSTYRQTTSVASGNAITRSARFVVLDQWILVDAHADAAVLFTTIVINEQVPRMQPWVLIKMPSGPIVVRTQHGIEVYAIEGDHVVS